MMWSAKMKAREIKMRPEARKATKKRPLSSPSRTPPLPIVLATPYSKPLASPSEAEKVEVMKVAWGMGQQEVVRLDEAGTG